MTSIDIGRLKNILEDIEAKVHAGEDMVKNMIRILNSN